jgi:hypothetical protein
MTPVSAKDPQQQRRAAVRTALVLGAVALAIFAAFLWSATHPQ